MNGLRHRNLLVCSSSLPRPDGASDSRRLFRFVAFLRAAGCGVTCVAEPAQDLEACAGPLTDVGAKVVVGHDEHLERLARAEHFDWALLGNWNIARPLVALLRAAAPATRIVIDSGTPHLLQTALRSLQETDGRLGEAYASDAVRELAAYAAADAVLTASRQEARLIGDLIGDRRRTFTVPDSDDLAASPFPFRRRRGMLFVGDFAHRRNADALAYLCDEILPHVDPALLADEPLYVAGANMTDEVRDIAADRTTVRMLGWVHSVLPYLQRVRVSLFPLRCGAAAKTSVIETLFIGTPAVTTSVGCEGFSLGHERDVLVADDPVRFAAGITRLLTDEPLWSQLARAGRETIRAEHGHDAARRLLFDALVAIRAAEPAARKPARKRRRMSHGDYAAAIHHARDAIVNGTPPGATVAVVSRGDDAVVKLDGRTGWHFPLADDGSYAGSHPATGSEAIDHLEAARERGAEFFAIPAPSAWWLSYYGDLRTHLESRYRVLDTDGDQCVLVSLRESPAGPQSLAEIAAETGVVAGPSVADHPVTIVFQGLTDRHTVTRSPAGPPPALSVVIPTRDRAALLAESLDSLTRQTAGPTAFEVVVVSDGSTDGTVDVCRDLAGRLRLTLVESPAAGIAVARNIGVDAATAPLVLFLDDDDAADPGLVAAHLSVHRRHPLEHVAALGHATWHPRLPITELMRFITDEHHHLFGPTPLRDGQLLDHTFFLGGRSSCKKSLLVRAGGFRPELACGSADIEAGYRIGRMLARERPKSGGATADLGLTVVFCGDAVQHMLRPITYDEFCRRCERQGRSRWQFSRCADDRRVDEWCGVPGAARRWAEIRGELAAKVARVRELERDVETAGPDREGAVRELQALYAWTCDAFQTKGLVEAAGAA